MADERKYGFRCSAKADGKRYRLLMTGYIERDNKNAGAEVLAAMERMPAGSALEVHLRDFYGGDVNEGLTIYHAVKDAGADIHIDGVVASMGTVIACGGKKVTATKRSKGMTHQPRGGDFATAAELREIAAHLDEAENELGEILAERTGLPLAEAKAAFMPQGKDVWFTADQMKAKGLVDEVVAGDSTRTLALVDVRKLRDAEDILGRFAALYEPLTPDPSPSFGSAQDKERGGNANNGPMGAKQQAMKKEITAKLDLAEGADEAAVEQAIDKLKARAEALEKQVREQAKAEDDAAEAEATGLIEAALKEDRIGKPQAEALKAEAKKAPKMALSVVKHTLGAMPAHKPLSGSLNQQKPGAKSLAELVHARADWSYARWAKEDSKALGRLRDEAPELFKQVRETLA